MTNILDTVEPDGWADEESLGATSKSVTCQFTAYSTNLTDAMMPIYSRETVESILTDYEEVLADHRRLVRELDVLMHGEEGAAKQASLCDLVAMLPSWKEAHRKQVLLEAAAILERKLVQPSGNIAYGILRRMAEGEKHE
jgi:hypothetical protein